MTVGSAAGLADGSAATGAKSAGQDDKCNELIDICRKGVKIALSRGADRAETAVMSGDGFSLSVQNNSVNTGSGSTGFGIAVRILRKGRPGFAYCTRAGDMEKAAEQAVSASSLGRETGMDFPGQPPRWPDTPTLYDSSLAGLSPGDGMELVGGMVSAVTDMKTGMDTDINVTGGGVSCGTEYFAIANSTGLAGATASTTLSGGVYVVCRKGEIVSTGSESEFSYVRGLDLESVGAAAARLALDSLGGRRLEGGTMPVVFTPDALSNMVEFIIAPAFFGNRAHKGESVYSDRLGEMVTHPELSIYDDGLLPGGYYTRPFDDEGIPSGRVDLVRDGELKSYIYDLATAAEYDTASTGSGLRGGGLATGRGFRMPVEPHARNLTIQGKNPKSDLEAVIAGIDRGVVIHEILGAHTANPASGDFSVNSSTLFYIENGEIAYPVKQAMLSGNLPEALKNLIAIGKDFKRMGGDLSPNGMNLPTLALDGIRVTG